MASQRSQGGRVISRSGGSVTATEWSPRASRCTTMTVFARVVAPGRAAAVGGEQQDVLVAGLGGGVEDAVGRDVDGGDRRERPRRAGCDRPNRGPRPAPAAGRPRRRRTARRARPAAPWDARCRSPASASSSSSSRSCRPRIRPAWAAVSRVRVSSMWSARRRSSEPSGSVRARPRRGTALSGSSSVEGAGTFAVPASARALATDRPVPDVPTGRSPPVSVARLRPRRGWSASGASSALRFGCAPPPSRRRRVVGRGGPVVVGPGHLPSAAGRLRSVRRDGLIGLVGPERGRRRPVVARGAGSTGSRPGGGGASTRRSAATGAPFRGRFGGGAPLSGCGADAGVDGPDRGRPTPIGAVGDPTSWRSGAGPLPVARSAGQEAVGRYGTGGALRGISRGRAAGRRRSGPTGAAPRARSWSGPRLHAAAGRRPVPGAAGPPGLAGGAHGLSSR